MLAGNFFWASWSSRVESREQSWEFWGLAGWCSSTVIWMYGFRSGATGADFDPIILAMQPIFECSISLEIDFYVNSKGF